MSDEACPFCAPAGDRVFFQGVRVIGLWDAFPVSPGHALLVTRRHVESWFDATREERAELLDAITVARSAIQIGYQPDGYNVGINIGRAAGQTILHLHVHLIPRYSGDAPDPRGGVRRVLPRTAAYPWPEADAGRTIAVPDGARVPTRRLVRGGSGDPLLPQLLDLMDTASAVDITAAFTLETGVRLIEEHVRDVLRRGGSVRVLTGDYLGVTEPAALLRLLDLDSGIQVRIYESAGTSFHPKAYILREVNGNGTAFVGSSNLSETALRNGVEWNYRVVTSADRLGFQDVVSGFEELWRHPQAKPVTPEWVRSYAATRIAPPARTAGAAPEPVKVPTPHEVQVEALAALEATRASGNAAGLVVLATGLGKTWLSAFDSNRPEYRTLLFVAHREEILAQAMRTFRAIRPNARLGPYTGSEKDPDADVVFASIQTLGRSQHLRRFDPRAFDYVVVDEFHHAAAQTYRRVLDYLEPKFLLGLTATPERTDGGDLLSLCGDNLVYRCDVPEGIKRKLLSPFAYYGVPDETDYENIPWRNNRFDEEALTNAVATQARAENALDQLQRHGGKRTIAFCVSQRHADYTARFLHEHGVRAVAVHAGITSAPRAHSLEKLESGELEVVCAVDMFNEGVDLPNVDTIVMLRPSESRVLWLQQFGRGLRPLKDKTLRVIDYIGNHRVFLNKPRALLQLGNADRDVAYALERLEAGTLELPPGCSVTYELEAKDILRSLVRTTDRLRDYYIEFRQQHGVRPLAVEAFEDGYTPASARRAGYRSWMEFVQGMGDFSSDQEEVCSRVGDFLRQLEITPMTRSYKMVLLLAMIAEDAFPGSIEISRLLHRFAELSRRFAVVRTEVGEALESPDLLQQLVETNPVAAWVGGEGTGGISYFSYADGRFSSKLDVPQRLSEATQTLAREIAEWRLSQYLRRHTRPGRDRFSCQVGDFGGESVLVLPDRESLQGVPDGWLPVRIEGEDSLAHFGSTAVDRITLTGSAENLLPNLLRRWFGAEAGQSGRADYVEFERFGEGYSLSPETNDGANVAGPVLWQRYRREDAAHALGITFVGREAESGVVRRPGMFAFFVTLEKREKPEKQRYKDEFLSPDKFQWQSQNRTTRKSAWGREMERHQALGVVIHLFVRRRAKLAGRTEPFLYAGRLLFDSWEGDKPITIWWRLHEPVPDGLHGELTVPTHGAKVRAPAPANDSPKQ